MRDIQILDTPLTTQSCHDAVADPAAGGIVAVSYTHLRAHET